MSDTAYPVIAFVLWLTSLFGATFVGSWLGIRTPPREPTPLDLVKREAKRFDYKLTDRDVEWVLWERTGFPEFWPAGFDSPIAAIRHQAAAHFSLLSLGLDACMCCGRVVPVSDSGWPLCSRCEREMAT